MCSSVFDYYYSMKKNSNTIIIIAVFLIFSFFAFSNTASAAQIGVSPQVMGTTTCSTGLSCGLVGYWTFDGKDTPWTSALPLWINLAMATLAR